MKHSLTGKKDADRILRNMVVGIDGIAQVQKGDEIVYWTGDFRDEVGIKPVGREAMRLEGYNRVRLFQKRIAESFSDDGVNIRVFEYTAVVR